MWPSSSFQFPSLHPPLVDSIWLSVDRPSDDEAELTKREEEHQNWLNKIAEQGQDIPPIGKSATEQYNNEEEDEEEDEEEGEESESQDDDEIDDLMEDHESPDDDNDVEAPRGNANGNQGGGTGNAGTGTGAPPGTDSPPWAL
jgi:hypothetical protein